MGLSEGATGNDRACQQGDGDHGARWEEYEARAVANRRGGGADKEATVLRKFYRWRRDIAGEHRCDRW